MTKAAPPQDPPRFEAAVAELESIVARMESGQLALEDSLAAYRRGVELLKLCQKQLGDAEAQLRILDEDTLKQFAVAAEKAA